MFVNTSETPLGGFQKLCFYVFKLMTKLYNKTNNKKQKNEQYPLARQTRKQQ